MNRRRLTDRCCVRADRTYAEKRLAAKMQKTTTCYRENKKLKDTQPKIKKKENCNLVGDVHFELTDCDMIRSMIICEVSEQAKEKGLPETAPFWSSSSAAKSSCMTLLGVFDRISCGCCGASAFETSTAETLQDRDRNSIGSRGVSGGRNSNESGRQGSGMGTGLSMFEVF